MWIIDMIKWLFAWNGESKKDVKKFELGNYAVVIEWADPANLIKNIQGLKEVIGMWLKEAKEILSWGSFPKNIISWISKADAEEIKQKLEEMGIKVKIEEIE